MQFEFEDEEEFTPDPDIKNDEADEVEPILDPSPKDDQLNGLNVIGLKIARAAKNDVADEFFEEESPPQSPTKEPTSHNGRSTRTLLSTSYSHATEPRRPNPQVMAYSYMTAVSWERQHKTEQAIEAVRKKSAEELADTNHSAPSKVNM